MTGPIKYKGANGTKSMINWIEGKSHGQGMQIGGGGSTILSSGEAGELWNNVLSDGSAESLAIMADYDIEFYTNLNNGFSSGVKSTINQYGQFTGPSKALYCQLLPTGTNLNNVQDPGLYFLHANNTYTNAPSGVQDGFLLVLKYSSSIMKQILYKHGTGNATDFQTYVRTNYGSQTSNWRRYLVEDDIPEQGGKLIAFGAGPATVQLKYNTYYLAFFYYQPKSEFSNSYFHVAGLLILEGSPTAFHWNSLDGQPIFPKDAVSLNGSKVTFNNPSSNTSGTRILRYGIIELVQ